MSRIPTKLSSFQYIKEHINFDPTIVDIGVQYETKELKTVFCESKHLLFEPVSEYYPAIKSNYANIDHQIFEIALSNCNQDSFLSTHSLFGDGQISHSSISDEKSSNSRVIPIRKLDSIIPEIERETSLVQPFVLKIDVDGVELQILEGSTETLAKTFCVIVEAPLSINHNFFAERFLFLHNHGFILWDIVDCCYYKQNLSQVDLVFLSESFKRKLDFSPWSDGQFQGNEWITYLQG
jgi:FkbM family methyltransferase